MVEEGQEQRRETSLKAIAVAHEGSDGRLSVKKVTDKTENMIQLRKYLKIELIGFAAGWVGGERQSGIQNGS